MISPTSWFCKTLYLWWLYMDAQRMKKWSTFSIGSPAPTLLCNSSYYPHAYGGVVFVG